MFCHLASSTILVTPSTISTALPFTTLITLKFTEGLPLKRAREESGSKPSTTSATSLTRTTPEELVDLLIITEAKSDTLSIEPRVLKRYSLEPVFKVQLGIVLI